MGDKKNQEQGTGALTKLTSERENIERTSGREKREERRESEGRLGLVLK